uniref:EGF-like domain-containing protein n=1 Tax=Anopheles epiroticus TaxID=199890 RepID=A0A182PUW2_9DIPT
AHHTTTAVYQVTRLGHENCDVTEGVLLDITPLVADGKKLVTLYDKDLTEGINLLIVVSEQWGHQCVRLKVTVKSDNCGENADCSGKGVCYSNNSMEGYECQCCSGFAGTHCEEIDACSPSPCTNNGICVDLSQGHEGSAYQCLCPYGYTGKNCQFESDPCNPSQCLNGGTCVGNSTHFRCDCTSGYTGPLCQHNLNECESSPCVHGICVDQEDGFRCFCQPGFSGELCNFEYNECESNPCINGGQCIDNIGGFSCKCTRGYTGKRCHIKVSSAPIAADWHADCHWHKSNAIQERYRGTQRSTAVSGMKMNSNHLPFTSTMVPCVARLPMIPLFGRGQIYRVPFSPGIGGSGVMVSFRCFRKAFTLIFVPTILARMATGASTMAMILRANVPAAVMVQIAIKYHER